MKLRIKRKSATGWAAHERYRQVLADQEGQEHWSCIVTNCSERSELEADNMMLDWIVRQDFYLDDGVELTDELGREHHLYP